MTGGVCAILDTPLKFNHHLAGAKLSDTLLSELVCTNVALRVYGTASKALARVLGGIWSGALSMVFVQCDTLPPHAVSALLSACSASFAPASEALALLL